MPRRPPQHRAPRLVVTLLGVATLVASATSCGYLSERLGLADEEASPSAAASATATEATTDGTPGPYDPLDPDAGQRLAALTRTAEPGRIDVCRVVPDDVVRATLDLDPDSPVPPAQSTLPGDPAEVQVDGEERQVPVAEFGCAWTGPGGPTVDEAPGDRSLLVRVFAPELDAALAAPLVRAAREQPGCRPVAGLPSVDAPGVGSPGTALACGADTLRYEGLVGDAYVVCGLTRADLTARLGPAVLAPRLTAWCAEAISRLDTSRG